MSKLISRISFPVVTRSGIGVEIEARVVTDTVEIWRNGFCIAVFDRGHLRAWLADPREPIGMGQVTFTLDRYVDLDGRIAITLPDVDAWTLGSDTVTELAGMLA